MGVALPVAKREQKRARVWLAGHISTNDWEQEVRVHDISKGGALMSCESPPAVDTIVSLLCGTFQTTGRVAWAGNSLVGIQFLSPVAPEELLRQTGPALRVTAPRAYDALEGETCG